MDMLVSEVIGLPPNDHPFLDGIFMDFPLQKPTIWGYLHFRKTPYITSLAAFDAVKRPERRKPGPPESRLERSGGVRCCGGAFGGTKDSGEMEIFGINTGGMSTPTNLYYIYIHIYLHLCCYIK